MHLYGIALSWAQNLEFNDSQKVHKKQHTETVAETPECEGGVKCLPPFGAVVSPLVPHPSCVDSNLRIHLDP